MWHRSGAVAGLVLALAALAPAQPIGTASKAVPPDTAALERLNLRTEWSLVLPVEGTKDAVAQVQTFDDQMFVQTRSGMLVAVDTLTGRIQWAAKLGNGVYGNAYPVAVNSQYVFCAHLTRLYAFYRYTGVTEFVHELGTPTTTGLAADDESVYCVLGMRPGAAGAHRIAVYDMLRPIPVNDPTKAPADALAQGAKKDTPSPLGELVKRYPTSGTAHATSRYPEITARPAAAAAPVGGVTGSRTPAIGVLPSVVPPYNLDNRSPTPAINVIPSLRPPYTLRLESGQYVQQTPSIGVIPPSVAASLALADLRPKAPPPPLRWEFGLTSRILYPLLLTPTRAWAVADDNTVMAFGKELSKEKVVTEVKERFSSAIPAAPVAAGTTLYVPLDNGILVAISGTTGNLAGGINVKWRAATGGLNNHAPFVSKDRVYAAGDNSGVVCFNRDTGDTIWRSDAGADRVIGANEEFVYVRDRQGRFLVYDAKRPTNAASNRSAPLGSADFGEFNVPVVNTASDRVYLAANNGLIVCLRDANAKYAKPMRNLWPAPEVSRQRVRGVEGLNKDGEPKSEPEPKKEPEKKEPEKN
ncbi:outer membrane biogenesis protein BamB [Gemmata obscuriglobus]|uniref:Pyrrolo-quinoline quinone repeat domain-containing protein n=1 Tax=Gemmata obscuriglobus TaxID=114 RepID=A0A2Z3HJP6_9BACT|nr:PQQ-binding-like beta-propeller repeat protein [Gemmata obscuriglobus]AWM42064.1 hypothetical protein C1280_37120 [Gemmata obscuriglobus]QEG31941.1 outer membrane biogenesis protein BamB [Gemmata obscuriglobus]VTS11291.1 Pyrrolo-quinoline quinone repeat-containing protein OS=Isosphaera pallida (strain ATCC 43644 / DSM 9630 / IS1B) GN=Isop_2256 PE=4 SV=1: PQQ_2 [Gemmata obscuriglobus UQM 2246]